MTGNGTGTITVLPWQGDTPGYSMQPNPGESWDEYQNRISGANPPVVSGSNGVSNTGVTWPWQVPGEIGKYLGYGLLAYSGYKIFRTRRVNLINIAMLAGGLYFSGILKNIGNYLKENNISIPQVLAMALPGKAGQYARIGIPLAVGMPLALAAIPAVAGLLGSVISRRQPRRRIYYRPYYRRRYYRRRR